MKNRENPLPFSQRNGLSPVPPQLALGEVSAELRRLIQYSIHKEIERVERGGFDHSYFDEKWKEVATDLHVRFFQKPVASFKNVSYHTKQSLEIFVARATIGPLSDLVEFFLAHPKCSVTFSNDLSSAFVSARAAYRIIGKQVVGIGMEEQAHSFEMAVKLAGDSGYLAAKQHLVAAGLALRHGKWPDSARESIHAVESIARSIAESKALGDALRVLESRRHINGRLRAAFDALYAYTNSEPGIRHSLLKEDAEVDEADALFMLGTCASFVSYLIMRSNSEP